MYLILIFILSWAKTIYLSPYIRDSNLETRKPLCMMSYEHNLIVNYLSRNSFLTQSSKSSKSIYFSFKGITFRYSDHRTISPRRYQIQVIRKSKDVFILLPGEKKYTRYNERTGFYFLRRLVKESEKSTGKEYGGKIAQKYRKQKLFQKEKRKFKKELNSLSGVSKKDLKTTVWEDLTALYM